MSESVLVKGRNRETARALLDSAKRLGLGPEVVQTSSRGGYLVPKEVYDGLGDAPGEDFTENPESARQIQALQPGDTADEGPSQDPKSYEDGKDPKGLPSTGPGHADRSTLTATEKSGEDETKVNSKDPVAATPATSAQPAEDDGKAKRQTRSRKAEGEKD